MGLTEIPLLLKALDDVFGDDPSTDFYAIDCMRDLIEETYQKHENISIKEDLKKIRLSTNTKQQSV